MTIRQIQMTLLLGILAGLSACAMTPKDRLTDQVALLAEQGFEIAGPSASISARETLGWTYLDPYGVIVGSQKGPSFLVTFSSSCRELRRAVDVSTTSSLNFLTTFDSFVVTRLRRAEPEVCAIDKIYVLRAKADAAETGQQ